MDRKISELKAYEFHQQGPFIIYAPERKYVQKFQTREEYHDWLDNDLRTFG